MNAAATTRGPRGELVVEIVTRPIPRRSPSELERVAELPALRQQLRELEAWQARDGRNVGGDLEDELQQRAAELADRVFQIVAEKIRGELPLVLEENDEAIRGIVASSIKTALGDSHIDERISQAEGQLRTGLVLTAIGAAVLSVVIAKALA